MLGSLARWLRFCGFDTIYPEKPLKDKDLIAVAVNEDRILITRDTEIGARRMPGSLRVVCVKSDLLEDQFEELIKSLNLKLGIENFMIRCSLCNTILVKVPKCSVVGKVPEGVYRRHRTFWYCEKCTKYYWKGSHWDMILKRLKKIQRL